MKYIAASATDKARFYISRAPPTAFSTAILNVNDFNTEMFFYIFEHHMQSNAKEVIDNGWSCTVSLYIFPNNCVAREKKKKKVKRSALYKNLGKNGAEFGRGRITAKKHGREVRHGVFQITGSTNCCFALALLVGRSFLNKDNNSIKLNNKRDTELVTLYSDEQIADIYNKCNVSIGGVRVDQLHIFYENYLASDHIDLVVFSKQQHDTIVYDSRLDENKLLHRVTNNGIFLWLNEGHYDVIQSPYTFSRCSANVYCFCCMRYFSRWESQDSHVCRTVHSCQTCYSSYEGCKEEEGFFKNVTLALYTLETGNAL